jgi:hypothetical protein
MASDLARLLIFRSLILWVLVRITLLVVLGRSTIPAFFLSTQIAVLVTILYLVDITRRGERLLFANLGLGRVKLSALTAMTTIAAEIALSIFLHLAHR